VTFNLMLCLPRSS